MYKNLIKKYLIMMLKTIKISFLFFTFLSTNFSFSKADYLQTFYKDTLSMAKDQPCQLVTNMSFYGTLGFLGYIAEKRYSEGRPVATLRETLTAIGMVISSQAFLFNFSWNFHKCSYYPFHKRIYESFKMVFEDSCGKNPDDETALAFDIFMVTLGANILLELKNKYNKKRIISTKTAGKKTTSQEEFDAIENANAI